MRAILSGSGIYIALGKEDKKNILKKGHLEWIIDENKKRVVLFVKSKVKNDCSYFEDRGFHIESKKRGYKIFLSKEIWNKLTGPIPERDQNNYFVSRSVCDRIEFVYWEPKDYLTVLE